MLEHFDGISPAFNGTPFKTAAETMIEKGYTYDYISDLQLKSTVFYEDYYRQMAIFTKHL